MKIDDPVISTHPDLKDNWLVMEDFSYQGHGVSLFIPKGFRTDLASIPRLLWRLIAPFELSLTAPIVHDMLYRSKGKTSERILTRAETDLLFFNIMTDEGVNWWRRKLAYWGVRMGGGYSWGAQKVEVIVIE